MHLATFAIIVLDFVYACTEQEQDCYVSTPSGLFFELFAVPPLLCFMHSAGEIFHKLCSWAYHPSSLDINPCKFSPSPPHQKKGIMINAILSMEPYSHMKSEIVQNK